MVTPGAVPPLRWPRTTDHPTSGPCWLPCRAPRCWHPPRPARPTRSAPARGGRCPRARERSVPRRRPAPCPRRGCRSATDLRRSARGAPAAGSRPVRWVPCTCTMPACLPPSRAIWLRSQFPPCAVTTPERLLTSPGRSSPSTVSTKFATGSRYFVTREHVAFDGPVRGSPELRAVHFADHRVVVGERPAHGGRQTIVRGTQLGGVVGSGSSWVGGDQPRVVPPGPVRSFIVTSSTVAASG